MTELTLFASTFILVFALGLQSLNVNNGNYRPACELATDRLLPVRWTARHPVLDAHASAPGTIH
jgi:hypothetical protein